ncbi:MAG: DegV family protein [Anaerolineae bacterium]|nr:DegV family protein [Anaerolineae bacterium]
MAVEPQRRAVRIVTDTTAVLPPEYCAAHGVEVVPQVIIFGEESYLEGVELSSEQFMQRLRASAQLPKTAAPPPGLFVEVYGRLLREAETIISIHPSTDVSGTVRSALTAKEESFPGADIRILDTRTAAGCVGSMVRAAVGWTEDRLEAGEIVGRLQAMIPRSRTYFLIRTLEYLQKGGRIGGAAALLGSVLQVKPILELRNGRVEVLEKVRVHSRARERLVELVAGQCPRVPESYLCVMHADARPEAEELAADLGAALELDLPPVYEVGAAVATHAGPGVLGVGFFV